MGVGPRLQRMAGNVYNVKHDNGRDDHYYVRTDDNYILHDDGTHYYDKHDDQHHYSRPNLDFLNDDIYNDNLSCHDHDDGATTPAASPTPTPDSESACTGDDDCPYAYDIYHYYEHHTAADDNYEHDDNDYLYDTAIDDDGYNEYDEYDDPADYEHLVTGYDDSFHHDRWKHFPIFDSPQFKRLFDIAVKAGLGGSYNTDHHISAGGHDDNDSATSTT